MNESQLCYYMDSVTKNTPILLKENENIKMLSSSEARKKARRSRAIIIARGE